MEMEKPQSIRQWQGLFFSIYGARNDEIYSPSDILLHVIEEMAELAEHLRKEDRESVVKNIPDVFGWLLAFCNTCEPTGIDLENAVWHKYPSVCPYCLQEKNCTCISQELKYKDDRELLEKYRNRMKQKPFILDGWQQMFERIYGRVNKIKFQVQIWFHLFEEIGEISRAFRLGPRAELEAELADAFAWLVAACNKLQISLSEVTWQTYPGKCRTCLKEKCQCPVI